MLYLFLVIGIILGVARGADAAKYTIKDKNIGDLRTKVLMNRKTREYVQIVTDLGGRIEDLVLRGSDNKPRSSTHSQ